jgi:chlorophyllide a reductase subunit Y
LGNQSRFDEMNDFFAGVGAGFAAGVWSEMPIERPAVRKKSRKSTPQEPTEAVGAC